jgi:hypothetical protein
MAGKRKVNRIKAQYFTAKGHYGPTLEFETHRLDLFFDRMARAYASLPEELEGEKRSDWIRCSIEIERVEDDRE